MEKLTLRWNLLKKIEGLSTLTTLVELDLYDNQVRDWRDLLDEPLCLCQIEKIEGLDSLVNLHTLDLSFNRFAKIENLESLVNLKTLYMVHNKLEKIEGLETVSLR